MPALSKQTWIFKNDLDVSNLTEQEIWQLFRGTRNNAWQHSLPYQDFMDTYVMTAVSEGKTQYHRRQNLVDITGRRVVRLREFTNAAGAQDFVTWVNSNIPPVVPMVGDTLFERVAVETIDNMTLEQFVADWPNN